MKKMIAMVLLSVVLIIPFGVRAATIQEYPPYINVSNSDLYDIEKIIDNDTVTVRLQKKNEKTFYSWTFDRNSVGETINIDFELDFTSSNKSEIDNLSGDMDKVYLSFKHHGTLPSSAKITVYVGNKYKNGEKLYLYYFNEESDEIEFIDKNLKVVDGYVEFQIDHCSEYFLTDKAVKNATIVTSQAVLDAANTNMVNYIIIAMIVAVIGISGKTMYSTRG